MINDKIREEIIKAAQRNRNIKARKMFSKILFIVNSHVGYKKALEFMLPKLAAEVEDPNDIIVIVGGSEFESGNYQTVQIKYVTDNYYDYTSIIYLLRNPKVLEGYDYIFYMHDTCCPYPGFYDSVYNFERGTVAKRVWSKSNSNLGLYSVQYLLNNKEQILEVFTPSNAKEGQGLEDKLFPPGSPSYGVWETLVNPGFGDKLTQITAGDPTFYGYIDPYGDGSFRRSEYHRHLNMVKFKSNMTKGGYDGRQ